MNNTLHKNLQSVKNKFENKLSNEGGIYQLVNLINGKSYVGSTVNLHRRINEYLNPLYIDRNLKKGNSKIMNALLKYGYINFGIRILEDIEFNFNQSSLDKKNTILAREQHFLELIKPEYNINQIAGSNLGRVYSDEVRKKMSLSKKGKPGNKKGAILSYETKQLLKKNSGKATKVLMLNENNEILDKFNSIEDASNSTGISRNRISRCARNIRKQILEKGQIYIFKYDREELD